MNYPKGIDYDYPKEKHECLRCGMVFDDPEKLNVHISACLLYAESLKQQESICSEAERIINGPRRDAYGPVEESFEAEAKIFSGILQRKLKEDLTANDVALLMVAWKLHRESVKHQRDNLVDIIGYTLLQEKLCNSQGTK